MTGRVWKVDENAARVRLDQCVVTGYLHRCVIRGFGGQPCRRRLVVGDLTLLHLYSYPDLNCFRSPP